MGLILPANLTRLPQSAARVRRSDPITKGLVFLTAQASNIDIVSNVPGVGTGSGFTKTTIPAGIGSRLVTAGSAIAYGAQDIGNVTGAITCLSLGVIDSIGSDSSTLSKCASNGASNTPFDFGIAGGGALRLGRASSGFRVWAGAAVTTAGKQQMIAATQGADIGVAPKFYIDGVFDAGAATSLFGGSGSGAAGTNTTPILVQNRGDATTPLLGVVVLAAVWNRELSAGELARIAANPAILLETTPPRRLLVEAPAGGVATYSYTASGGFVLSGSATKVRGTIKTATGGATFSGSAAQSRGAVKSASGGILFAGAASQVRRRAVTPAGGLTLSGAATIRRAIVRSAAGGLNLAGAATISFFSSVQTRVITPVGGFILAGASAVRRSIRKFASGGITLGGHATASQDAAATAVNFSVYTIMRATVTNRAVPAPVLSIAVNGGTMRASNNLTTIMRALPINRTGPIRATAINRTGNLL